MRGSETIELLDADKMPFRYHVTSGADAVTVSWRIRRAYVSDDGCRRSDRIIRRSLVVPIYSMPCGAPGDPYLEGNEMKYSAVTTYTGSAVTDGDYVVEYVIEQDSGAPCDCQEEHVSSSAVNMVTYCEPYFIPPEGGETTFYVDYDWVTSGECMGETVLHMSTSYTFTDTTVRTDCDPSGDVRELRTPPLQIGNNPDNTVEFLAVYGVLRPEGCDSSCSDTSVTKTYMVVLETVQYSRDSVDFSGGPVDVTFQYVVRTVMNCKPSTSIAVTEPQTVIVPPRSSGDADHCDDKPYETTITWSPEQDEGESPVEFVIPVSVMQLGDGVGCEPTCESAVTYCVNNQSVKVFYPMGTDATGGTIWEPEPYWLPASGGTVKLVYDVTRQTLAEDCTRTYETYTEECECEFDGVDCQCDGIVLTSEMDELGPEGGGVQFEAEEYGDDAEYIDVWYKFNLTDGEACGCIDGDETYDGCCQIVVMIRYRNNCDN